MSGIMDRICARCRRQIDLSDLSINEGKPYHDHCILQSTRSRIAFLSDKMGRRTATVLDAEELKDLLFVEERMKNDIENQKKFKLTNNDKPVFFGNTPLGEHSAMNSPRWKKLLAHGKSLDGTKYHLHKIEALPESTTEPKWEITTDESGHKGVIQAGTRPLKTPPEVEGSNKKGLVLGESDALIKINQEPVDYETERIHINVWRGFELLEKLVSDFNLLDLNARVAALNKERNQQFVLVGVTA